MRRSFYNLAGLLLALTFGWSLAAGQTQPLPLDQVIEKVSCASEPDQSYALFLPPGYTPEQKWPILYAFDPVARGTVPVKLFQAAAARFGFIVVGSNNSRNGIDVNAIIKTLWIDTHERFAIDEKRVYVTGFSGGARIANAVALAHPGTVAGVIAASGGLPPGSKFSSANQFVVFGTAGTEDFNFPEMQQIKRKLDELGFTNRLAIFPGGHDWPPAELCNEALAWLETQAMKSGTRARDEQFIDQRLGLKTKAAHDLEASQNIYDAFLEYEALVIEFQGLRETKEFAAAADRLRNTKEVRAGIKSERAEEENQANLTTKMQTLISGLQGAEEYPQTMVDLRSNLSDLAKKSDDNSRPAEQRVAKRVLHSLVVRIYEEVFALKLNKNYASIPTKLELLIMISPKSPRAYYDLAEAYARLRNKSKATKALGRAIELGFTDLARIEKNEDFANLRDDADYKRIIAGLKKS